MICGHLGEHFRCDYTIETSGVVRRVPFPRIGVCGVCMCAYVFDGWTTTVAKGDVRDGARLASTEKSV